MITCGRVKQQEPLRTKQRATITTETHSQFIGLRARGCSLSKNVAQNSVLLFRRTPFGRQGAYPVLAQTSSNGHMQNQHKTNTFLALTPGGGQLHLASPEGLRQPPLLQVLTLLILLLGIDTTECKTNTKLALF